MICQTTERGKPCSNEATCMIVINGVSAFPCCLKHARKWTEQDWHMAFVLPLPEGYQMTTKEMIDVMQAFENGKTVEMRPQPQEKWQPCEVPLWNWIDFEYRVKHEPRIIYANEYPSGFSVALHPTAEQAKEMAVANCIRTVKFVEVLECSATKT